MGFYDLDELILKRVISEKPIQVKIYRGFGDYFAVIGSALCENITDRI